MDSRNDTLFPVTTAAPCYSHLPLTEIPIVDASGLPTGNMNKIGYTVAGLWHFDDALMHGTPYIAIASEWAGVLINNISQLQPMDTLGTFPTGGWTTRSKLRGDTLWVCHEGYGLVAYNRDSLYFSHGYMTNSKLMHINQSFVNDFDFIDDTSIVLTVQKGDIYNIKPWLQGGNPVKTGNINTNNLNRVLSINTNVGTRVIAGTATLSLVGLQENQTARLINPYSPSPVQLDSVFTGNQINALEVSNDTLFCGLKINTKFYLAAYKVENDHFVFIDTIVVPALPFATEINYVSKQNNKIAIGSNMNVAWYNIDNGEFISQGSYFDWHTNCQSIKLKNNYIYIADKFYGLKVLDISQPSPTIAAQFMGTRGWMNVFGSNDVNVGDDGKIYLSDFNAGIIIINAYDTTLVSIKDNKLTENGNSIVNIYPNPATNQIFISFIPEINSKYIFEIYNINGNKIFNSIINNSTSTINTEYLPNGIYLYQLKENNVLINSGKIIINK